MLQNYARCVKIHDISISYFVYQFSKKNVECFQMGKNSFEQISINFVNEKIRNFCTSRLITDEIKWHNSEGLDIPKISFLDNQSVIGKLYTYNALSIMCT